MRRRSLLFLSLVTLAGCSSGTDFENPEHVSAWANSASALAVFLPAYEPIARADGEATLGDATCPTVEDDGTTMVVTGDGCTASTGHTFEGTVTVERVGEGYEVTFERYGHSDQESVPRLTGAIVVTQTSEGVYAFDAEYVQDGLLTLDVDYQGTLEGGYDMATLWNGSGTVTRGGFTDSNGTATVTTVDQLRDDAICGGEAASGTTTIELGSRTLVIEYDGARDCNDRRTAQYSVDGVDQGEVEGITCSASPGRGGSTVLLASLAVAALALLRRRSRG